MIYKRLFGVLAVLIFFCAPTVVLAQFSELTKWIPDDANCLVLVRVDDVCRSEMAVEQDWAAEYSAVCDAGIEFLPSGTKNFVVASNIDYQFMEPLWTAAIYEKSDGNIDVSEIANMTGGSIDNLAGSEAVFLQQDVYLVKLNSQLAASMAPANRQNTIRWLAKRRSASPSLSPYLQEAEKFADENADIIVAFDLEHVFTRDTLKEWLKDSPHIDPAKMDDAVDLLMTLKGATLGITVNDSFNGAIKLDFASDPTAFEMQGRNVFLDVLARSGLMIDDFQSFKEEVSANQFKLSGKMSPEGIRKIGLLINHPAKAALGFETEDSRYASSIEQRSRQYFRSVNAVVQEFEKKSGSTEGLNNYATWFEKHAREIDEMPVVNVDPDLVELGHFTAVRFRDIASAIRAIKLQYDSEYKNYPRYSYRCGRYGCYYDTLEAKDLANAHGKTVAHQLLTEVSNEASRVRKELSQKYGIDF
ncbi:MAG: hypothetical protein R3C03_09645 [Pirellulaceae bacterium]